MAIRFPNSPARRLAAWTLCLAPLAALTAQAGVADRLVAVVNDELITASEVTAANAVTLDLIAEVLPSVRQTRMGTRSFDDALQDLIDRRILLQEAQAVGVGTSEQEAASALAALIEQGQIPPDRGSSPALKARIQDELTLLKLINREVRSKLLVSSADIDTYYRAHPDRFTRPARFRISQIVFRVPADADADARAARRAAAEAVRAELEQGADFTALAKEHSDGPESTRGGDLGTFQSGELLPAIDQAVATLEVGAISPIVSSPVGFHIVKLTEKGQGVVQPLEEVRDDVEELVYQEQTAERYRRWLRQLRHRAHIDLKS